MTDGLRKATKDAADFNMATGFVMGVGLSMLVGGLFTGNNWLTGGAAVLLFAVSVLYYQGDFPKPHELGENT